MPRPMPTTRDMVSQHTLAHEVVTRDKKEVFDDEHLDLLERFVSDPSCKKTMMEEFDWFDEEGQYPGKPILLCGLGWTELYH